MTGIPDGATSYLDSSNPSCNPCYYKVWNVAVSTPPPTVDSVVPPTGLPAGGTSVSVYGYDFISGAIVLFGSVPATNAVVVNPSRITCTTPAGTGTVSVTVRNPNGQEGTLPSGFTYQ